MFIAILFIKQIGIQARNTPKISYDIYIQWNIVPVFKNKRVTYFCCTQNDIHGTILSASHVQILW